MRLKSNDFIQVKTISELHETLGLRKPKHPLFSVHRYENVNQIVLDKKINLTTDFYQITLKRNSDCKLKYGQTNYDFNEGVLSFFAPKQITIINAENLFPTSGWLISIHPDFLNDNLLALQIKEYGFFQYSTNEALFLSDEEEKNMDALFQNIEREYHQPIDNFSKDVVLNIISLMLTYANRYYNRQFITRKPVIQPLLSKVELILTEYFRNEANEKLPSAETIAEQLNISPRYLSSCLKQLTGQNLQQHIHEKLIERAKELLASTSLSVSEVAYQLGFEYPQSFSKLFKTKTNTTPLEYRKSFN